MHPNDQEHENELADAARRKAVAAYGRDIENAIAQARCDVATARREHRVDWSPEENARYEQLLEPFAPDKIYMTVYTAVATSLSNGAPCVLAQFTTDGALDAVVAFSAAIEAVRRIRETGREAQYRLAPPSGELVCPFLTYQVKLLDI